MHGVRLILLRKNPATVRPRNLPRVLPGKHTETIALATQRMSVWDLLRRLLLVWNIAQVVGIFDFLFYSQIAPFSYPTYLRQEKYL
jgi:calcineurin-like phosphoesterase